MTVERYRSQLRQRGVPESSTRFSVSVVEDLVIVALLVAAIAASVGIAHFLGRI
jgi:hypothetical protein